MMKSLNKLRYRVSMENLKLIKYNDERLRKIFISYKLN